MSNKIKISIPPEHGQIDHAQSVVSLHAENSHAGKLVKASLVLSRKAEHLERSGYPREAASVADVAALAINAAHDIHDSN
jgi:hypothetical protein